MKLVFHKRFFCNDLLSPVMLYLMMLILMQGAYHLTGHVQRIPDFHPTVVNGEMSGTSDDQQNLRPGDMTPSNFGERSNCFQNGVVTVEIEALKFIRSLFEIDDASYQYLGHSYWYSSVTYQINLPPGWSPSIPISYRRLVI